MPLFDMPTKDEVTNAMVTHCRQVNDMIQTWDDFAGQMDRLTDAELTTTLGFTTAEKDEIRSATVAMQYIAKYYRFEDTSAWPNDPSFPIKHMLDIFHF